MTTLPRNTILVPVDYSDDGLRALGVGCEVLYPSGALHVAHVIPSPTIGPVTTGPSREKRVEQATLHLEQFLCQAGIEGTLELHILEGDPGHEIVKLADAVKADLIVMPSHGRTGVAHVLIGSVAERVVRLAHCPVLVLRK